MTKKFIIPTLTFVIGGGVGLVCGMKGFSYAVKHYVESDEFEKVLDEKWDEMIDETTDKVRKEGS